MKIVKNFRSKYLIFLIIILALFSRLIFLDRIPTGMSNDELDYILNAKSIYLSGSDISHTWNPLSFTTPKSSFPQAEIPPLVTFWLIGILPLSLFTSKFIYALISTGIVVLLFFITKKLIGGKEAFFVGLAGVFNPWLIFFGRSSYDTSLAVFFFLLVFYMLLISKNWKILLAFPAFFLAFYSYIGMKLLLLPFAIVIITYAWYCNKKYTKKYLLLFFLCCVLFLYYIFSMLHSSGTRISELASPNMSTIAATVNSERKLSIQSPLTFIFSNKYNVFTKYALDKYFNTFSPSFLFINGDGKSQFSLWFHGVFYFLDVLFLLIGIAVLFATNKKVLALLSAIVLIAPIPSVLSTVGNSYAIRSMLLAPIFIIFIGVGISYVLKTFRYSWIFIAIPYAFLILNFINIYFLRNPLYNSESFGFSSRVLAKYLSLQTGNVYVINGDPRSPYKQYLFYNNVLTRSTAAKIAYDFSNKDYSFGNIRFITCKQLHGITPGNIVIYDSCAKIPKSKNDVVIPQLSDGGSVYTIQNDSTCSKYSLHHYPYGITFSDLNIEKLSEKRLCQQFITSTNVL